MLVLPLLLMVSIFLSGCSTFGTETGSTINNVVEDIVKIGMLEWLGVTGENYLTGFMRLAVFILIFVVLFEVARHLLPPASKNAAIAGAAVLALISAIFIPGSVLAAIGVAYATLFSFILIGVVVIGGLFLVYMIPTSSLPLRILRVVLLFLLFWILSATVEHAKGLVP